MGAEELHRDDLAYHAIDRLIKKGDMADVLDLITHTAGYIAKRASWDSRAQEVLKNMRATVERLFHEESLGYHLDKHFGVRYIFDMEFEEVRLATVAYLGGYRYKAVLAEFENAYRAIETTRSNSKLAVRSMFEAIETLFRLIVGPRAKRLGSSEVRNHLLPMVRPLYGDDPVASNTTASLLNGLAEWANGLQAYRHGQPVEEPAAPPLEAAVAALQTGSAYIRLLVELDRKLQASTAS